MIIKNNFRIYTAELAKKFVKEGMGIGWCLKRFIKDELENEELYEIPVNLEIPKTIFSLSYEDKFLNKTAYEFLKFFKNYIRNNIND